MFGLEGGWVLAFLIKSFVAFFFVPLVTLVQLVPSFGIAGMRHGLSAFLVATGGILAVLSIRRWQQVQDAMSRDVDLPPSRLPMLLAIALLAVTVLLLILLFFGPGER